MESISLIIPAKNEIESLGVVLEEIKNYDYVNEIIVVVDSEEDNSIQVAKKYDCRIIIQKQSGYGAAIIEGFQNANNKYDVYIFINDNFVTKIKDGGCKLEEIDYWGLPSDITNPSLMIKSISRVFESRSSIKFDSIFQNKYKVNWDNSANIIDRKLNNETTNDIFSETKGFVNYPVSFKNDSSDYVKDTEYVYTFDAGNSNTINFNFIDNS